MPGPFCFAWAGGELADQVTLVTNGNTHGARLDRATFVGDVNAGNNQLINMGTNQGLEVGWLYRLSGPGVTDGTYFVYDDSVLVGFPGSINLFSAATGTLRSGTFEATKSTVIGTVLGTLSHGSNVVLISDAGSLPDGVYGVFGTGIGETNVPIGTTTGTTYTTGGGIMEIGYAWMQYAGGVGTLHVLAATPHTTLNVDLSGQQTSVTTYTVAPQAVRATAGGLFPIEVTGFPTGSAYTVTNIPSLSDLMPGLVYNISGSGIQTGTTFVAPSGGTSIDLDLPAESSEINDVLTIAGPRTPNAPFDPAVHNRFDEEIISVEIAQEEGGFATLTVDIKNPGIGLLATGRMLWAWLSWDQAWTPEGGSAPDLVPLFNGRLIGVPRLQANEVVQLQFLARPDDFNVQKLGWADYLAVLPYYDPIWYAQNLSSDTVLEAYSSLWHIDRSSLAVSVSDILQGEDGTVSIGEDQTIYDRFSLAYGQPPLISATISGTVSWQQQAEGIIDVTQAIVSAFHTSGSAYAYTFAVGHFGNNGGGLIQVLCGDGLKSDWPSPGTSIGGGWSLSTRNDGRGYPLCYIIDAVKPNGWMMPLVYTVTYEGQPAPASQAGNTTDQSNVNIFLHPFGVYTAAFPLNVYKVRMNLEYKANRKRTETVTAVLTAGVQRELSDSSESDRETISLSSEYVGQGVDPGGVIPIGNVAYRSYFQTTRGGSSFEYLLLLARAKIRARGRAVDVTFAVDWRTALGISLRQSIELTDRRLPGGTASGKVKSYRLTASTTGMLGEFTIGCTIGSGDGYDMAYQTLGDFVVADDGLNLTNLTVGSALNECVVTNGMLKQVPILHGFQHSTWPQFSDPIGTMRTISTTVTLDMKPVVGGEFHTDFYPSVAMLSLPRTIDLSAYSPGWVPPPGYPFAAPPDVYVPRPPVTEPFVPQPGDPVYAYVGYVVAGYQHYAGAQITI
jgi:hypothetical protein